MAAYTPFTPSDSEQRLLPPYYRGCWHGVSRSFLWRYRQAPRLFTSGHFVPLDRGLQPKGLHPPHGVARSGFPPLPKPLDCCLPEESGPYLSPSVAGRPLRPATHRRLGEPLPRQLANGTRDHPRAAGPFGSPPSVAKGCPSVTTFGISHPLGRLSPTRGQVSHALLTRSPLYSEGCPPFRVRLACLIHAASVRSEPGSNSSLSEYFERALLRGLSRFASEPHRTSDRAPRNQAVMHAALFSFQRAIPLSFHSRGNSVRLEEAPLDRRPKASCRSEHRNIAPCSRSVNVYFLAPQRSSMATRARC